MKNEILTIEEAYNRLSMSIPTKTTGRQEVLDLVKWISEWNQTLPDNFKIICYLRDDINIGFMIDRDSNRDKIRKPRFMVIKHIGKDRDFKKYLHLDFYLGIEGYKPLEKYINKRPIHPSSWVLLSKDYKAINFDNIKILVKKSYEKRTNF